MVELNDSVNDTAKITAIKSFTVHTHCNTILLVTVIK
jgi:hypothetical protein